MPIPTSRQDDHFWSMLTQAPSSNTTRDMRCSGADRQTALIILPKLQALELLRRTLLHCTLGYLTTPLVRVFPFSQPSFHSTAAVCAYGMGDATNQPVSVGTEAKT
ncbi:hypothetical protein HER10_EVM0000432 [Colletotrichum scovillei]|uniref:uncharacterized protein n=1 Tax=Colletotrichum scovillei TaxID=1209932 RepID=UPI0015C3D64D|nr:uncharacterized protein HER10_EVM0000432 [Colletotrichum scovillei]KAF4781572.1 hypothetical protein HER10_EVM0000432 [Colletotrichum scovillei]